MACKWKTTAFLGVSFPLAHSFFKTFDPALASFAAIESTPDSAPVAQNAFKPHCCVTGFFKNDVLASGFQQFDPARFCRRSLATVLQAGL